MSEQNTPQQRRTFPVASRVLEDGRIIETVFAPATTRTSFAVYANGKVSIETAVDLLNGDKLVPVPGSNDLIRHEALRLPERAEPYGTVPELAGRIATYFDKYLDLSTSFRRIASYYALLSWVYDAFNELPYLRLRGDFGSGKTRGLTVLGGVCYRAFFASGASTVSPIFHTLDSFGGTLILDEADFRFTDEKSELVKVLNNGNVRGFPVLRTALTLKRDFEPRAFQVFGPKIVAMRKSFEDRGLESRFITEDMGHRKLRESVPISLPDAQCIEAAELRNQLLMYRFENLHRVKIDPLLVDARLSPRQNQILGPILAVMETREEREEVREMVGSLAADVYDESTTLIETHLVEILCERFGAAPDDSIPLADIANCYQKQYGDDQKPFMSNREIGGILRRSLGIRTQKRHGVFVVPATEREKINQAAIRYGIAPLD